MAAKKNREVSEVNASSMADIAFLLLIFFLVTTTIDAERGISLLLPPKVPEDEIIVPRHERNVFKILVNSQDKMLVEDEPLDDVREIRPMLKEFILNNGKNPKLSDNPKDAVVSFKINRGTSYEAYIAVLDELKGAYYEIYGERVGLTALEYRSLDERKPREKELFDKGREGIPKNISIAEPSK
jgi:biopolymer transport protein ExbD